MIVRLWLKLSLLFIPCLTFCILLTRAQPNDDSQLRALLAPPDDCPSPCFMGIRPEVTNINQAIAILAKHAWVDEIDLSRPHYVSWTWSGLQPPIVNHQFNGVVRPHYGGNAVETIEIVMNVPIGSVILLLGQPDDMYSRVNGSTNSIMVAAA